MVASITASYRLTVHYLSGNVLALVINSFHGLCHSGDGRPSEVPVPAPYLSRLLVLSLE